MEYELSQHARQVLSERGIPAEWVQRALENPEQVQADPTDGDLEHRLARIPEHGQRVLRVIIRASPEPVRVVTAYFDRAMKDKL